ncbi:hypothetical protein DPV78_001138 [Talaromyces pinophilus]|nr:hypothetical protein DPV78_001138 [Talaromyces pinophilus]
MAVYLITMALVKIKPRDQGIWEGQGVSLSLALGTAGESIACDFRQGIPVNRQVRMGSAPPQPLSHGSPGFGKLKGTCMAQSPAIGTHLPLAGTRERAASLRATAGVTTGVLAALRHGITQS